MRHGAVNAVSSKIGFSVIGVDISGDMLRKARESDPTGDYRLIREGDFSQFKNFRFDFVLSAFTFDNIPTLEKKAANFRGLGGLLKGEGTIVSVVSSPEDLHARVGIVLY